MLQTESADPASSCDDQRSPDGAKEPFEHCHLLRVHPLALRVARFPLKYPIMTDIPG